MPSTESKILSLSLSGIVKSTVVSRSNQSIQSQCRNVHLIILKTTKITTNHRHRMNQFQQKNPNFPVTKKKNTFNHFHQHHHLKKKMMMMMMTTKRINQYPLQQWSNTMKVLSIRATKNISSIKIPNHRSSRKQLVFGVENISRFSIMSIPMSMG